MRKLIFILIFFSTAFFINYLHENYLEKKVEKNMEYVFIKDPYQDFERNSLPKIMIMSEEQKNYVIEILESIFKIIHEKSTLEKEEKNVIEVLSNQLEIEKEMTSKIIEVIFLKNKGNIKGI